MRIRAIQTGTVAIKRNQQQGRGHGIFRRINTLAGHSWTAPLPIFAWVIEHPEGLIVVDTGETSRSSDPNYFTWWHPYFKVAVKTYVERSDEIDHQLHNIGYDSRDVRWLVLTHLHTDHAGGLHHFPRANILVSSTEYQVASGVRGKLRGYLPQRWPDWFSPTLIGFSDGAYGPFPKSHVLTEACDVMLVPTPGHTYGHLSVIVRDGALSYFLAGDTSYTQELLVKQAVDGVAPNEFHTRLTLSRIIDYARDNPTVYLPSHDPHAQGRLEGRTTVF